MIPTVRVLSDDVQVAVTVVNGTVFSDPYPDVAGVVLAALARDELVELTATGPFRAGLDGDPVHDVEYVAGILAKHGFTLVDTDPARGTYDTPEGAVQ